MSEKSRYINSWQKRLFDLLLCCAGLVFFLPITLIISIIIWISDGWPVFFVQKRIGKNGKVFRIIKFRTMLKTAEQEQEKYRDLNEANGPVFKIKEDPRFTGIGKWLSHTGLDELPQFINVIRGEMSLIGPRPLPVNEHLKLHKKYLDRISVKPGVVSEWVIKGGHQNSFEEWMRLDLNYIKEATLLGDFKIMIEIFELCCCLLLKS